MASQQRAPLHQKYCARVLALSTRPSVPPGTLLEARGGSARRSGSTDFCWLIYQPKQRGPGSPVTVDWRCGQRTTEEANAMCNSTQVQKRERAMVILQQAFAYVDGPARVRALLAKFKIKRFSEVPDELCADLLTEAEKLLAVLKDRPPAAAPPVFNQATALAEFALVVDRVKRSVPDEAAHRRLDWAMQRAMVNPWRLEGCEIEHELEEIAADEDLFADYTAEELLASERRLARILDFEHATPADYFALIEEEYGRLVDECEALLWDSSLQPILHRLLRALVSAPLSYRAVIVAICDPRGDGLDRLNSSDEFHRITAILQLREAPERDADGDEAKRRPRRTH
jgi:hypothetical protein